MAAVHVRGTATRHQVGTRWALATLASVAAVLAILGSPFLFRFALLLSPSDDLDVALAVITLLGWFMLGGLAVGAVYRRAGHPRPYWLGSCGATVALIALIVEFGSVGFLLYGQLLAVPVPIIAGVALHRRMQRA